MAFHIHYRVFHSELIVSEWKIRLNPRNRHVSQRVSWGIVYSLKTQTKCFKKTISNAESGCNGRVEIKLFSQIQKMLSALSKMLYSFWVVRHAQPEQWNFFQVEYRNVAQKKNPVKGSVSCYKGSPMDISLRSTMVLPLTFGLTFASTINCSTCTLDWSQSVG